MRLDRWLLAQPMLRGMGRRPLGELLASSHVRVNGARARKGTIVREGDVVTFTPPASDSHAPATTPLSEVYADADVLALDKPPGIPSTVGRRPGASIASALLERHPEMAAFGDARHAGLVHRLDTGTSGLLLAARHADAHARLRTAFAAKRVAKDYLAVVVGEVRAPTAVTTPLARAPRSRRRMVVTRADRGWPARTEVSPLATDGTLSVVGLRMRTGVTHQLRVHLASIGHPVLGDVRYGSPDGPPDIGVPFADWHYLHARAVTFDDAGLPPPIATPFPVHWRPLFAARGWRRFD
jgi:23S rRNA pseudouridine1911/1915/1917 synthase